MSLNQQIINQLKNKLSQIEEIEEVHEWLSRPLDEGEYPALIIRDPMDKVHDDSLGVTEAHALLIEIDLVISPNNYEAVAIRELIPKIKRAIRDAITQEDFYYHGHYIGREIIGEHRDYFYIASRLKFEINFETEKWSEE